MEIFALNPYPNNTTKSFDKIVDLNSMFNGKNNTGKIQSAKSMAFYGKQDRWSMADPKVIHSSAQNQDAFDLPSDGQYMNNRITSQETLEKHMRLFDEDGQLVANQKGGNVVIEKIYKPKPYVYLGMDGHYKLSKDIINKYAQ